MHQGFSKFLTEDKMFRDFAEASCHNEVKKKWFEDVIKGKSNKVLDIFCQEMSKTFLHLHVATLKEGQGSSLHVKVFSVLQSQSLSGMIPHDTSVEIRQCFVSVAVVLMFEFERKQRRKLVKFGIDEFEKHGTGILHF